MRRYNTNQLNEHSFSQMNNPQIVEMTIDGRNYECDLFGEFIPDEHFWQCWHNRVNKKRLIREGILIRKDGLGRYKISLDLKKRIRYQERCNNTQE